MQNRILEGFDSVLSDCSKENANKDSNLIPTMRDLTAGLVSKAWAEENLPPRVKMAHDGGHIHVHDLDYSPAFPMFNCMLIDIKGMLEGGFTVDKADIATPKSIGTATAVTAQIIAQVASHIYGGNSVDSIDIVLAPYVRASYNKLVALYTERLGKGDPRIFEWAMQDTKKETYDAFQALEYEINTLHTANGQTPFTTLGFGLGETWEAELIQEAILKNRIEGLGVKKKTAVFPKLVYAIKGGHNRKLGDPFYHIKQLALECSSKRMYPDIVNYDQVVKVTGNFKFPMGCRSFLTGDERYKNAGRNNLGVVSINLPSIAIESQSCKFEFTRLLDEVMEVAKEATMFRVNRLKDIKAEVAPILYTEGACGVRLKPDDTVFQLFEEGRASVSIGYIGLSEMCENMKEDPMGDFGRLVLKKMHVTLLGWKEEDGLGWALYGTPSESLCNRFYKKDLKFFGDPLVERKGYYTNSFHVDVRNKISPFEKIDFESKFPPLSSGGFISYVELPNMVHNLKGLEAIWDYTYDKLPYFAINTPTDFCGACGWFGETKATIDGYSCPACGNTGKSLSVTRRVCGYLGNPDTRGFNEGKQQEVMKRVKHL